MRYHIVVLIIMFALPVLLFQLAGAQAQSTYAVSARVPATCPRGISPNADTGLCPANCPSNTAANTNGECVPLPVVIEEPVAGTAPRPLDAATPVDPARSLTCPDGKSWDAALLRCEH